MRFKWEAQTKRRWYIWDDFQDLIDLCESIDGPIVNKQWFLDELETVGELGYSKNFIDLYNSKKKYKNPKHSSLAYYLGFTDEEPQQAPVGMSMSQGRKSLPDIDLDFEDRYREDVIEYTRERYGREKCAQISTFGEMGAKKAVRDVARVLDYPYELGDKISKAMPPAVFGVAPTLEKCLQHTEFRELYDSDEEVRDIVYQSRELEGLWRDAGVHAAGLVVADADITDYVPVLQRGEGEPVVTQWDMIRDESCGLLKIDFLGLRNLSIVSRCKENIKKTQGIDIGNPYDLLEHDDPKTYDLLQKGHNIGVFQMESGGFRDLMLDVQPTTLDDIAAMLALYRPGPMGSNVHREYASRKRGSKSVQFLDERLKPILGDTFGLLLYQDQLLSIVKDVAGATTFEADEFRKIVGKKILEKMPAQRQKFVQGCANAGMSKDKADKLFDEIEHHAAYSFNMSHAFSYSFISYITAYLKANYPIEYMAAALSSSFDDQDRIKLYLDECKRMGIEVDRPSINYSKREFIIKDEKILYGFDSLAGFGDTSAELLAQDEVYSSIHDFLRRVSPNLLNRKAIQHLLKAGAFDELLSDNDKSIEMDRIERVQLLFDEAEQLGVFLKQHPFIDLQDLIIEKVTQSISSTKEMQDGSWVTVGGIIRSVTKKTTRAGKRMFILEIEDNTDSIEVVVFAKVAEELDSDTPFVKGQLVVVEGKTRVDGEGEVARQTLVYHASELIDFANASTEKPIYLEVGKLVTSDKLKALADIIKRTQGSSTVIIKCQTEEGREIMIRFNDTTSLKVEDTLKKIIEV